MNEFIVYAENEAEFNALAFSYTLLLGEPLARGLFDWYWAPETANGRLLVLCSRSHSLCEPEHSNECDIATRLAKYVAVASTVMAGLPRGAAARRSATGSSAPVSRPANSRGNEHAGHAVRWSGFLAFCFDCRTEGWGERDGYGTHPLIERDGCR